MLSSIGAALTSGQLRPHHHSVIGKFPVALACRSEGAVKRGAPARFGGVAQQQQGWRRQLPRDQVAQQGGSGSSAVVKIGSARPKLLHSSDQLVSDLHGDDGCRAPRSRRQADESHRRTVTAQR